MTPAPRDMEKAEISVYLEETGKTFPYQWYHNDIFINGEKCGTADYDKKQGLLIGQVDWNGKRSKFFYHPSQEGIARKVRRWAENQMKPTDGR